jgi:hypothetical protein
VERSEESGKKKKEKYVLGGGKSRQKYVQGFKSLPTSAYRQEGEKYNFQKG